MFASALLSLAQEPAPSVASFFARGIRSLVVGTAGDERADRGVAAQTRFIGELLFPEAPRVEDRTIDVARGVAGWPGNALVYGGEHVNAFVAALGPELPIRVRAHELAVAGQTFRGDEYRLLALVPGRASGTPAWPAFVWFAGTGSPGVAEINAYDAGADGFLIVDRFGPLCHGRWVSDAAGGWKAELGKCEKRFDWRLDESVPASERWSPLSIRRLQLVGARPSDAAEDAALVRGARAAAETLGLDAPAPFEVYVYPDRGSLRTLTGKTFDGRADVESRTLHVLPFDAAPGGPLESLLRHEATHVLAYERFGAPGSTLER